MGKLIGVSGAPSTGKSTLARSLVNELAKQYNTVYVPEFATDYIANFGPPQSIWEQIVIYYTQKRHEDLHHKADFVVTDSPTVVTMVYASMLSDFKKPKHRLVYTELLKDMLSDINRYDIILHMPIYRPQQENHVRVFNEEQRNKIDSKMVGLLEFYGFNYKTLEPNLVLKDMVTELVNL